MLAALIVGVVVSAWQVLRATQARDAEHLARQALDVALAQKNQALAKSQASAAAADRERRKAQDAQHAMQITLSDMYTVQGLAADERNRPAEAVLWFANAAGLAARDPERETANRIRVGNWRRRVPLPVAAFSTTRAVEHIEFHPRFPFVMTASSGGEIRIWDLKQDDEYPFPQGSPTPTSAAWSPDGRKLAMGHAEGKVQVYAFPSQQLLDEFSHRGRINALAFSPDSRLLAVASDSVRVWDGERRSFAGPELAHPQAVAALVFNASGDRLATACRDNTVRVFAISESPMQADPLFGPVPHIWRLDERDIKSGGAARPVFLNQRSELLTRESVNETVRRHATTGRILARLPAPRGNLSAHALAVSPREEYVALGGWKQTTVWNVRQMRWETQKLDHANVVVTACFHPDGWLLLTGGLDRIVRLWSVRDGKMLADIDVHATVHAVAFSADGRFFAAADDANLVRVWRMPEGPPLHYRAEAQGRTLAKFSPDGRFFCSQRLLFRLHQESDCLAGSGLRGERGPTCGERAAPGRRTP